MRGPHVAATGNAVQIDRRNGKDPLATIGFLATSQLGNDAIGLAVDFLVTRRGVDHRRCRKPVAEEVSAKLAAGRLPTPVHVILDGVLSRIVVAIALCLPETRLPQSGLQQKVLQQTVAVETHDVFLVQIETVAKKPRQKTDAICR